ncbi:MAG: ATP-binding protein [Chryseolinea sp.]
MYIIRDSPLRILILEDVEEDAGLIDRVLKRDKIEFTRVRVDTRQAFIDAVDEFKPEIILSDHSLPQFNSIEALAICKQRRKSIPFILVTGAVSEEFAVNCLKQGADDYILKSNLSRLPTAIAYALRHHQYENTRARQEEQLVNQNKELVKINKELDSFVYSISHNLRSPLSSVLGIVNIAKLDPGKSPEVVDQYFEMIEGSVKKLDKTLQEILDYSLNIRTDLEVQEIDLNKIVHASLSKLSYIKGSTEIRKYVNIHQAVPFHSDMHRIAIIFDNLISNSLRYSDNSKEQQVLNISADINPAYATVTVRDNGIGIPEQHLSNVFNMFFKATDRSEGAGLGLYIAREMVEKLKGTISIQSVKYEETVVSFTVPNKLLIA